MRTSAWLVVVLLAGCKKEPPPSPPPPPTAAGPCTLERLEAWRPSLGVIASRERLPETSTEERVELLKEARPNCDVAEDDRTCRARVEAMVRKWVPPDAVISLEPYEEPNAKKWRGTFYEPDGTVNVGGKDHALMKERSHTDELFDSSEACLAFGRTRAPEGRYGCSPAATWGFVFKAERRTSVVTRHGQRLQVLWLYPKGADAQASLVQFKDEVAREKFDLRRAEVSNPGGWEVDLACP